MVTRLRKDTAQRTVHTAGHSCGKGPSSVRLEPGGGTCTSQTAPGRIPHDEPQTGSVAPGTIEPATC